MRESSRESERARAWAVRGLAYVYMYITYLLVFHFMYESVGVARASSLDYVSVISAYGLRLVLLCVNFTDADTTYRTTSGRTPPPRAAASGAHLRVDSWPVRICCSAWLGKVWPSHWRMRWPVRSRKPPRPHAFVRCPSRTQRRVRDLSSQAWAAP